MLIVWYLSSVPNLVQIYVIVTEIDALILQTFIWWFTQIKFRFWLLVMWSSLYGRDAASHKIWCRYLYPIWSYWHFFQNYRWRPLPSWICRGAMGPPTKTHSWCVLPVKISSWSGSSFQVIGIWIFCHSGLKVLFTPPNFQFLGVFPQNLGAHRSDPKKAHPCMISRLLSYRV